MSINNLTDHIDDLSTNIRAYIDSTIEYYKLDFFNKSAKGTSAVVRILVVGVVFVFFLMFISIGLSILIGNSLGSMSYGFFIVAAFYFLVLILLLIFGKEFISKMILTKMSKSTIKETDSKKISFEDQPLKNELQK